VRDEEPIFDVITEMTFETMERADLDPKELMLVRLAALVGVDAPPVSYVTNLAAAEDAGLSAEDVRALLIAVSPIVGTPRIVAAVSNIGKGLGITFQPEDRDFAAE
jgi:alkylhydroperoxidase/carboxymuconolactone decarboxylase family protein YurZ